jgi:hypothetical protein
MSLYRLSKFIFQLNRDPELQERFRVAPENTLVGYELSDEESIAILAPDIGLLYVLGVNGQILMHYAAFRGIEWSDYLQHMRDGVKRHGPVRAGIYAMTTSAHERVVE